MRLQRGERRAVALVVGMRAQELLARSASFALFAELALDLVAAGELPGRHLDVALARWASGSAVKYSFTFSNMRWNGSGLLAPEATWKYSGSPAGAGLAAAARIALTTKSTGMTSRIESGRPGNSGSWPRP